MPESPAPMMMASKSGSDILSCGIWLPEVGTDDRSLMSCFGLKANRSSGGEQTPHPCAGRLQGCTGPRALTSGRLSPYRRRCRSPSERATGERNDGPGGAKPAYLDRRQRSPALSGRRLAAVVCPVAPRRSRALLLGLALRTLLVGDALRRHLCRRTRSRHLFVRLGARRYTSGRPAKGAGA